MHIAPVMRIVAMAVLGLVFGIRAANAECTFHHDYYYPELSGACAAETIVPEGCPVHVATPFGAVPSLGVSRGDTVVTLASTMRVVDTLTVPMSLVDPFECSCAFVESAASFDRYEVTIAGLIDGDVVGFDGGRNNAPAVITIGPPGPCPAPLWPTDYTISTRCDRCPGVDTPDDLGEGGGCATSGGGGPLLGVLAGLLLRRRRR
jgi:hypothetical protein